MNRTSSLSLVLAIVSATVAAAGSSTAPTSFETIPPGEEDQIDQTVALTTQLLQQRYPNSMALRGVHPKPHGCVQAQFTINQDLPGEFRVGVFGKPGNTYQAWVRFSNATATVGPDVESDGTPSRGMAIKLMDVEGKTLLDEPGAKTQDFLMINQPMFAFANVAEYLELSRVQLADHDDVKRFFAPPLTDEKINTLKIIGQIKKTPLGSPLETRYFSASPFLFGKTAVAKFAVSPRDPTSTPVPANPAPDYLRQALKKSLDPDSGRPAVFDFQVQLRSSDSLPIENASAQWSEETAPFRTVASLTINPQDFDNPLRIRECEQMVFTPWHGLVEHQPLGGINRLRREVYQASSKARAEQHKPSAFPQ